MSVAKLIKGSKLTSDQRRQVLAAYVNRFHAIGSGKRYKNDDEWVLDHAFRFTKDGRLSGKWAEPHYLAENPDLAQKAFAAGQDWWHVGQHTAGVANARMVRYGFLKWWNNTSPAETKGHSKSYLEKAFREGWNRGKKGPQRIPNGRMVPARIKHNGKTYVGKVKRVNGKVKIYVTPKVARQINPRANLTQKYWSIQGRYGGVWEEVTAEEWKHGADSGRKEAIKRLKEYRENEPGTAFRLVLKREKIV